MSLMSGMMGTILRETPKRCALQLRHGHVSGYMAMAMRRSNAHQNITR
jgi:hypothetical protein